MSEQLRDAIQELLDFYGDGWSLGQFVVVCGLERIRGGDSENTVWEYAPPWQPDWMAEKLLEKALEDRITAEVED